MEKPWKVIAAFIGVFIAGAVFGGFFTLKPSARRAQPQAFQPLPAPEKRPVEVAGPRGPGPAPAPRPGDLSPQLMRQFTKSLKLTAEQREKVQPIVGRAAEDFQRIREEEARRKQEFLADVARVNERMYADVSGVLSDEQRASLQSMRQKAEERMQEERQKRAEELAAAKRLLKESGPGAKQPADTSK